MRKAVVLLGSGIVAMGVALLLHATVAERGSARAMRTGKAEEAAPPPQGVAAPVGRGGGTDPGTPPPGEGTVDTVALPSRWKPNSLLLPDWGEFLVEVVPLGDAALHPRYRSRSLRLMAADRPPHIGIRFRPAPGTPCTESQVREFSDQIELWLGTRPDAALRIVEAGPVLPVVVCEDSTPVTVSLLPYSIEGMDSLLGRVGMRHYKLFVKARRVEGLRKGSTVAKDLTLLHTLARPDLGPAGWTGTEVVPVPFEEAGFAEAFVVLYSLQGLSDARIRLTAGPTLLPTTTVDITLVDSEHRPRAVPCDDLLDGAHLQLIVRVRPHWWELRRTLRVEYEVVDRLGRRHTLEWNPGFD